MQFDQLIQSYSGQPLSRQVLLSILKEYKRPFDKLSELVNQQLLTPVKRGLFIPGPAAHVTRPEPYLLANHILGPSYVSLETALSYWRLIPEQVFEISSATMVRSKIYETPVGRFSYTHFPFPYYTFGQQQLQLAANQVVLIATPEKALCDKIIATSALRLRSKSQAADWLLQDMRMDRAVLQTMNVSVIKEWLVDAPKQDSLLFLIQTLSSL